MTAIEIADPNLKLAILDALAELGLCDLGDDVPEDELEPDEKIRARLLALPLRQEDLDRITELGWEGGHGIQHAIWAQWDGEDDYFDIHDLTGIEQLSHLERVRFACSNVTDFAPLARLPRLRHVAFERETPADISAFLDMASLESLSIRYQDSPKNTAEATALEIRGVKLAR